MNTASKPVNTKILVGFSGADEINSFMDKVNNENLRFDKYIIAYIDFLGMKQKMNDENSFASLRIMQFIINKAKERTKYLSKLNHIDSFKTKVFSDNIIIALKVNESIIKDQILGIINIIALIQFEAFFQFRFPLRGGITIGDLYIDQDIVWGTGLIEAYRIESSLALFPRVIIDSKVLDAFNNSTQQSLNIDGLIAKDFDGNWYIYFFIAAPNIILIPQLSEILIDISKSHNNSNQRVKQKINWIINQFNSYCIKFKDRGDYEKYIVPFLS